MRMIVRAKLIDVFGELILVESVYDNSEEQDTSIVTKLLEELEVNQKRILWWK